MSLPCSYCNVRPDIACRHRAADPDWTPPHLRVDVEKVDKRAGNSGRRFDGQGLNFKNRRPYISGGGNYRVKAKVKPQ